MAKTILIVDDEEGFQTVLEIVLRRAGYQTLTARNGREGLEMVYAHHPDLVILDNHMPEMTGSEVCRKIKDDPRVQDVRAVMYTITQRFAHADEWQSIGADAYLPKPSTHLDILRTVRNLLV
jgi:CheY-like chemotaxis protein